MKLVERIRRAAGVDLHLWSARDGALEHLAPAGAAPDGTPVGDILWLATPGQGVAMEVRGDPQAGWASLVRELLSEAAEYERELAEREEEIQLLHSIAETLAVVTTLEDAGARILREVLRVTGGLRASLWLHVPVDDELVLAAAEGGERPATEHIPVAARDSVSALAFREGRIIRLGTEEELPRALVERTSPASEPWVAVPITHSAPGGSARTVGVLNLIGRQEGVDAATEREARLLTTLARQIGSAIANVRLFEEYLTRERLMREMRLAQELQMKLLPDLGQFQDVADVAGRCVPAHPVGGDFYQVFRLSGGRLGVMLGDVTSHGFAAALIMALSISAAAIYARDAYSAGDLLRAIHRALIQKLESAEMFLTLFYGVIDPNEGRLTYANAGHAHAFRLHGAARPERLSATSPPLGIAEYGSYGEASAEWASGDALVLFTDGLTTPALRATEEALLQAVDVHRSGRAKEMVEAIFAARRARREPAPDDQTALVLRA